MKKFPKEKKKSLCTKVERKWSSLSMDKNIATSNMERNTRARGDRRNSETLVKTDPSQTKLSNRCQTKSSEHNTRWEVSTN